MRPASLYSIQADPYRNRRCSTKENSPTTPKSTTQLAFHPEPGRTHSYLPYSNHAPDFKQSRAELYVEEEDTATIASSSHPVDMINGELQYSHTQSPPHLSLSNSKYEYKRQQASIFHSKKYWIAIGIFMCVGLLAIIIYFCWPRIPRIIMKNEKAERVGDPADWGPNQQPWLRAAWQLNMTLDNEANFVPTRIRDVELVLMDRDTHQPFAWSRSGAIQLAPHKQTLIPLTFRVDYESQSVNDTTFKNLYNACGPQMPSESPVLNVTMQAIFHIVGIAWSSVITVQSNELGGLYCPFN